MIYTGCMEAATTGIDALASSLARLIMDTAREIRPQIEDAAQAIPLTPSEVLLVRHVAQAPGITPGELSSRAHMQRSNVSTTLRSLESKGLVERRSGEGDARCVELHPTPATLHNMAAFGAARAVVVREAVDASEEELRAAVELLERLQQGLERRRLNQAGVHAAAGPEAAATGR